MIVKIGDHEDLFVCSAEEERRNNTYNSEISFQKIKLQDWYTTRTIPIEQKTEEVASEGGRASCMDNQCIEEIAHAVALNDSGERGHWRLRGVLAAKLGD